MVFCQFFMVSRKIFVQFRLKSYNIAMNKKILITTGSLIIVAGAYYLISPAFRVIEINEPNPVENNSVAQTTGETSTQYPYASPDSTLPTAVKPAPVKPLESKIISEADFVASAHEVSGKALVIQTGDLKTLRFQDFETINGPDLRVWLATDLSASQHIDLGPIKATKGNVNYPLPSGVDLKKYNNVLVWCRAFRVLFSSASLPSDNLLMAP